MSLLPRRVGAARRCLAAAALLLGLLVLAAGGASAQARSVLRAEITGPITPVLAGHFADAIRAAQDGDHAALIVEMDTPGGLDTSMRDMVQQALVAQVPVVVYVHPPGGRAASAGAVIAFSAHVAAMAPGTNIGAATPITMEGGEVIDKVVEDAAAYVEEIAVERDRDVEFAVATVREGRSAGATEAVEIGAVDLIAGSLRELIAEIDGMEVELATEAGDRDTVTLATEGAEVVDFELSWTRSVLQTLANPQLAFLFMSIAPLAILYEFISPSGGVGLIFGGILLLLGLFSLAVLPVNLVGVALLLLAAGLFAAEAFAPGVGVFAAGGALALILAGLFLFPDATGLAIGLEVVLPVAAAIGVVALVIGRFAVRSQTRPKFAGQGGTMIGDTGVVRTADGRTGQVWASGAMWKARAREGSLERGARVRVVDMRGLELIVEPVEQDADV
ncbi:MAG TPA: NfeD family protein [Egibacteraceae bacterium]|nr:NfeD family protein [Egibacteraceae bacterium]